MIFSCRLKPSRRGDEKTNWGLPSRASSPTGAVLRSKTQELVRQEFFGLMMLHFAVRGLMHEAALQVDEDPDRLSFLHAVRVVRRKLPFFGAFSPSGQACAA